MTDDFKDVDPAIVEAVIANADAFLDADTRVNKIIAWGEGELKSREEHIKATGGTLQDFKKTAAEVEAEVATRLKGLESEMAARYPQHTDS